jgi:hypothetical protein
MCHTPDLTGVKMVLLLLCFLLEAASAWEMKGPVANATKASEVFRSPLFIAISCVILLVVAAALSVLSAYLVHGPFNVQDPVAINDTKEETPTACDFPTTLSVIVNGAVTGVRQNKIVQIIIGVVGAGLVFSGSIGTFIYNRHRVPEKIHENDVERDSSSEDDIVDIEKSSESE